MVVVVVTVVVVAVVVAVVVVVAVAVAVAVLYRNISVFKHYKVRLEADVCGRVRSCAL